MISNIRERSTIRRLPLSRGIGLIWFLIVLSPTASLAQHEEVVSPKQLQEQAEQFARDGNYPDAISLTERALGMMESQSPDGHSDRILSLKSLARYFQKSGFKNKAETVLMRILDLQEKTFGHERLETAWSLSDLGIFYLMVGEYDKALRVRERELTIWEKSLGESNIETFRIRDNVASLYVSVGEYGKAEDLFRSNLALAEKTISQNLSNSATSGRIAYLKGLRVSGSLKLSQLYHLTGDYRRAKPIYDAALKIARDELWPEHPTIELLVFDLGRLAWGQADWTEALSYFHETTRIQDLRLRRLLVYGDENFRRGTKDALLPSTDTIISFSLAASHTITKAVNLGLEIVLQRKSRVLDVVADSLSRLRQDLVPEHQDLLARYQITTSELAKLGMSGPGDLSVNQYLAKMEDLKRNVSDLETRISGHSTIFRAEISPVTLPQVQEALPHLAALLEWVRYYPFYPKATKREPRWGKPRYALYVLKAKGAPTLVDMGDAEALEIQVNKLLAAVRRPGDRRRIQHLARDLYRRLLQPVQAHLGSAKQLLLSPDGQLNLLPFGVLQNASGHSLADQYELTYLTSGRDLLRPAIPAEASRHSVLVADPAFDVATPTTRMTSTEWLNRRSAEVDRSGLRFERLQGTVQEARDLGPLLKLEPNQVLTEARATEAAVKQVQSPRILHLATHGFFLPNLPETSPTRSRGAALDLLEQQQPPRQGENPLLRSGLALAGANQRQSGTDDGLLTALEVSSLNLRGTQLAVLSACETGVGQVQNGEGVYGLRRALVLAGVRTQVVSLWKVDDAATQAFMGHYYRYVLNGMGRSAALRATQQKMRENLVWTHPYYWAAFVVIGDATPLPSASVTTTTTRTR